MDCEKLGAGLLPNIDKGKKKKSWLLQQVKIMDYLQLLSGCCLELHLWAILPASWDGTDSTLNHGLPGFITFNFTYYGTNITISTAKDTCTVGMAAATWRVLKMMRAILLLLSSISNCPRRNLLQIPADKGLKSRLFLMPSFW